mgnify:FL=1
MVKKKTGSAKRFGVRYGRTSREKVAALENEMQQQQLCPYCRKKGVKRVSSGIWNCKKCNSTFTGQAYRSGAKNLRGQFSRGAKTSQTLVEGGE